MTNIYKVNGSGVQPLKAEDEPSNGDRNSISILPDDLLLKIFSFLDVVSLCRCAQVSKTWSSLALHGSNWQHVCLFDFQTAIEGKVVGHLSRRCGGFLRTLDLQECIGVEDPALETISCHCPNIQKLVLRKCYRLTDATFLYVSRNCSHLHHLDLSGCKEITDVTCTHLSEGCPDLHHVGLSGCKVTEEGILSLTRRCVQLTSLDLSFCTNIDDRALEHIGTNAKSLVSISLQGCKSITDIGITALSSCCHQLNTLVLSGCELLTDVSLKRIGATCHNLRNMEVAGCAHFTDVGFHALANGCTELRRMDLEECVLITDTTLTNLSHHCPHLQKLVLSHCERITDAGIDQLLSGACGGEELQTLELDNCPLITDHTLEALRRCRPLQRVELFDCQHVSRASISHLQQQRPDITVHALFPTNRIASSPAKVHRVTVTYTHIFTRASVRRSCGRQFLTRASQVTTFLISQPLNQKSILPTSNLIISTSMQQSSLSASTSNVTIATSSQLSTTLAIITTSSHLLTSRVIIATSAQPLTSRVIITTSSQRLTSRVIITTSSQRLTSRVITTAYELFTTATPAANSGASTTQCQNETYFTIIIGLLIVIILVLLVLFLMIVISHVHFQRRQKGHQQTTMIIKDGDSAYDQIKRLSPQGQGKIGNTCEAYEEHYI
ncbi:hypothetical protein EMCRGX_G004216 [Ephydatia muelleri]